MLHQVLSEWLREVPLSQNTDLLHQFPQCLKFQYYWFISLFPSLTRFFDIQAVIHSELQLRNQPVCTDCLRQESTGQCKHVAAWQTSIHLVNASAAHQDLQRTRWVLTSDRQGKAGAGLPPGTLLSKSTSPGLLDTEQLLPPGFCGCLLMPAPDTFLSWTFSQVEYVHVQSHETLSIKNYKVLWSETIPLSPLCLPID